MRINVDLLKPVAIVRGDIEINIPLYPALRRVYHDTGI